MQQERCGPCTVSSSVAVRPHFIVPPRPCLSHAPTCLAMLAAQVVGVGGDKQIMNPLGGFQRFNDMVRQPCSGACISFRPGERRVFVQCAGCPAAPDWLPPPLASAAAAAAACCLELCLWHLIPTSGQKQMLTGRQPALPTTTLSAGDGTEDGCVSPAAGGVPHRPGGQVSEWLHPTDRLPCAARLGPLVRHW